MPSELDRLRRALAAMPEQDRSVFKLARFEDLGHAAIAERLGITVDQVEQRLASAMLHLGEYDRPR